ncbi:hypothetical protein AVEN_159339-1 [Araneus ventricosus]|uniref:Uncharacterized protein n=1 Tax=Araneus ventricosus TaxID=182803 RepID=A0A4Y2A0L9_ARAVE|nr:hypothetical protein AVEN_159339-1 [Araneus ventricosus]
MGTDISVEALTMTNEDGWSLSEIQKSQLEDPDIRPILKMKLNSADRPSCQEIAHACERRRRKAPRDTPSSPTKSAARLEDVHVSAGEQVKLSRKRMKTRYDSRATDYHFKEGDLVWMHNPKRRGGLSPKLQQNWEGSYTVVKNLNDVA